MIRKAGIHRADGDNFFDRMMDLAALKERVRDI